MALCATPAYCRDALASIALAENGNIPVNIKMRVRFMLDYRHG